MPQAKFTLTESLMKFVNRHEEFGFPDKSSVVRAALKEIRDKMQRERLKQSAEEYAEAYAADDDLQRLTDNATEDWPE